MELLKTVLLVPGVMAILSLVTRKLTPLGASAGAAPIVPATGKGSSLPLDTAGAGAPPSKLQLKECRQLGLTIGPGANSRQVSLEVNEIMDHSEGRDQKGAIGDAKDREKYGDALVKEWGEWQARCGSGTTTYMVVSEWGNDVIGDLMQFVSVRIDDGQKPIVRIDGRWPRIDWNPPEMDPYFEFKREVTLKPAQILAVEKVPVEIDMFDVEELDMWQKKAMQLAGKFRSSTGPGRSMSPARRKGTSNRIAHS